MQCTRAEVLHQAESGEQFCVDHGLADDVYVEELLVTDWTAGSYIRHK